MQKLNAKIKDLIKYNQQVVVLVGKVVKGRQIEQHQNGTLTTIIKDNTMGAGFTIENDMQKIEVKEGLAISIQYDNWLSRPAVRHIRLEDIKYIDIVQTFGGGGCTLYWAIEFLGLKKPSNFISYYVSEDDLLENKELVKCLTDLHNKLDKDNIEHIFDLESGEFCIAVKVVD